MCDIIVVSVYDLEYHYRIKKKLNIFNEQILMWKMSKNCMKRLHIAIKNKGFKKRQCVTFWKILNDRHTKHGGLGGGPICFFERYDKFLDCSKVNFDEFGTFLNIKFWCHTLTHGIVLRRLPPGEVNPISKKLRRNDFLTKVGEGGGYKIYCQK